MGSYKDWLSKKNEGAGGVFGSWEDRKPDQTSFRYIDSGLAQLQQSHPELARQIEEVKEKFEVIRRQITQKHLGHAPSGF